MSSPDEMGLTPEAALGYEKFFVPAIFDQWPPVIASQAEIGPGDQVLDVGCGTGVLTRHVATLVEGGGSVSGIDLSESMLGVARQVCSGVEFRQGNAMALPYQDQSFDSVVSAFMLMFVPEPATALSEMCRVLRPGGRLVVSVWQGLQTNPTYDALVEIARAELGDESADSLAWPFSMGKAGALEEIFAAGLGAVTITKHNGTATFPSVEELVRTEIQSWLLADSVSEAQILAIVSALQARGFGSSDDSGAITVACNGLVAKMRKD